MSSWVTALPNPPDARVLPSFRMFAVLGTWMEADVVAATVRNAVMQGCERVYLVDNDSPDDTVEVARREGAIVARAFATDRYDERTRLIHMNQVVSDVTTSEPDEHIWWLFLDADEFPHGPGGMTLRDYLAALDSKFRVVGMRYFNHYPSRAPHYVTGHHPFDFQPLCEELVLPMCPSGHRKHPLQRHDKRGARIVCDRGFHLATCSDPLFEPARPAFLHHFPFREQALTRHKLDALWSRNSSGAPRANADHDTHMLARHLSIDAVYAQDWENVVNFVALDPMRIALGEVSGRGVSVKAWDDLVDPEDVHFLRPDSLRGAWQYDGREKFHYGDDTTYEKGIAFLDGHGTIEDWGSGFGHAKTFVKSSSYVGIDGSSPSADKIADLAAYRSDVDCIFMRHVLEHNGEWKRILANAVASFKKRMVLVVFTPFSESTRQIATSRVLTSVPVPDLSFRKADLTAHFAALKVSEESLRTETQYGTEHVFYIER